jgi:hypothetical protein
MRAVIPFLLFFHPLLSPKLPPGGDRTQYHFFADGKGKVIDKLAREITTLVTTLDSL